MSRVGLVTLHEADNYGTCLQAFALQKTIENLGYSCDIIQFNRDFGTNRDSKIKTLFSLKPTRTIDILLSRSFVGDRKKKFSEFRNENLSYSTGSFTDIGEIIVNPPIYDVYVTGSDMVWSWESREYLDYFFLKFAPKNKTISYAPSFGNTDFTDEMNAYYKDAVRNIGFCSCREIKGKEYIENVLNKKCFLAVDPTLLVCKSIWADLFLGDKKKQQNVLIYMFGEIPRPFYQEIRKLEEMGYQVRYIPQCYEQFKSEANHGMGSLGPIEFVQFFHDTDFVITNTYHGLMFSLIFEKPFVMLHRPKDEHWGLHEERMWSVLDMLDLSERYIFFDDGIEKEYLRMDYSKIRPIMQEEIKNSYEFLKCSLSAALEE